MVPPPLVQVSVEVFVLTTTKLLTMSKQEDNKKYNIVHKEDRAAKRKNKAENDPHYVAAKRIRRYRQSDIQYGRGICTITADELVSLWNKGCTYCKEPDWHKLGLDRIDNSKPHTLSNVVCSCKKCNETRQKRDFMDFYKEQFGHFRYLCLPKM